MLMAMGEDFQAKPTMVLDQIQDVTDGTFCDMKICHQLSTVDEGHRTCQFKLLDNTIEGAIGLCGINVEPREIELHEEYNRFKNKDLIVLELDEKSFWVGPSDFEDSFNIRHSIDPLRDGVYIIRRLTKSKHKGLKFSLQIETFVHKLICILQEKGPFVASHLRYKMDMLVFLGCTHGYTVEKEYGRVKELTHSFMGIEVQFNDGDVAKKQLTAFQYILLFRTILGLANNIKSITKRDLEKYIQRHYNTGLRMVIVVFEVVKLEEVVEQVKKLFTKLSSNAITAYQLVLYEPTTFIGFEKAMLGSWSKNVGGENYMGSVMAMKQLLAKENPNDFARYIDTTLDMSLIDPIMDTHATSLTNYPLVLVVFKDRHQELHTTHSPQFLDLRNQHGIWSHSDYGFDVRNEVFDAGVWPELRSFLNTNLGLVPTYWKGFAKLEPDSWLKTATAN
ncbi:hypothetical protein V6N12_003505 [Hibiscus sabdariffa]|uniref:O-fucosyltransferase family protein n=1 Tax=Hibiscus sabdariffa TaxID=183260 RepID=A0ABR1ZYJ6_9ROSI